MREITRKAVDSFFSGRNFSRDNTVVSAKGYNKAIFLHGNCIFRTVENYYGFSLCGWNTNTTRERLNGILSKFNSYIKQKNWNLFYIHNGKEFPINENETYFIDNNGNLKED
jgi:hypothetical protein